MDDQKKIQQKKKYRIIGIVDDDDQLRWNQIFDAVLMSIKAHLEALLLADIGLPLADIGWPPRSPSIAAEVADPGLDDILLVLTKKPMDPIEEPYGLRSERCGAPP